MSVNEKKEIMPPFTPMELRTKVNELQSNESELHKILYAPFFLEKDRRARELSKRCPVPEEYRFNKKK